jgi:hypothetical protein
MKGTAIAVGALAVLAVAPAAHAEPTIQTSTSYTEAAYVDARLTSVDRHEREVKTRVVLLGREEAASVQETAKDTASLLIEQSVCDDGTKRFRTFSVNGVEDATVDVTRQGIANVQGAFKLAGTETTAASCEAEQGDAATARSLGSRTVQVNGRWSLLYDGGDGSEIEDPAPEPGPEPDPVPELPEITPPESAPCVWVGGSVGGGSTGFEGSFGGASTLPLFTAVNWATLTPGGGSAGYGYSEPGPTLMAGDC